MRVVGALLVVGWLVEVARGDDFPYRATVAHEAVLVRCGPGESCYPTSRLARGAEVEVHRHAANGWCAIRPPEGEFGLIAASQVKLLPGDDLVEVIAAEAEVWIGSQVAKPEQHRWQIHLQKGERAAVLGVRGGQADGETAMWYKVAPPAGEFRWAPREALTSERPKPPPEEPADRRTSNVEPGAPAPAASPRESPLGHGDPIGEVLPMPAAGEGVVAQASYETLAPDDSPLLPEPAPVDEESGSESNGDSAPTDFAAERAFLDVDRRVDLQPRASQAEAGQVVGVVAPGDSAGLASHQLEAHVAALHLELTLAVAEDVSRWRLGPLHDRAVQLQTGAASPEDRQYVGEFIRSIERFEALAARYRQYAETLRPSAAPVPAREQSVVVKRTSTVAARFEREAAAGVLAPLAARPNSPPYALLDREGRIRAYVTPAAGVDLGPFAGQTIRVFGAQDDDPTLQAPHVIASRATP